RLPAGARRSGVSAPSEISPATGSPALPVSKARQVLHVRTDDIEQAYEYFLGYAAQGLVTEAGAGVQVRDYLQRFDAALEGLGHFFTHLVALLQIDPEPYRAFITVIDRDARDAQAAVRLVLAQPSINSQLVHNLT